MADNIRKESTEDYMDDYEELGIKEDNEEYIYDDDDYENDEFPVDTTPPVENQVDNSPIKISNEGDADDVAENINFQNNTGKANQLMGDQGEGQSLFHQSSKKSRKRRIDIDDEDSIPDIRMSKSSLRRSTTRKDKSGTQIERPNDMRIKKSYHIP